MVIVIKDSLQLGHIYISGADEKQTSCSVCPLISMTALSAIFKYGIRMPPTDRRAICPAELEQLILVYKIGLVYILFVDFLKLLLK